MGEGKAMSEQEKLLSERVEQAIYRIRGEAVMPDEDLARSTGLLPVR